MIRITCLISLIGLLLVINNESLMAQPPGISWYTYDGGGGKSVGDAFELDGTIGQRDTGVSLGGDGFTLIGGFHVAIQDAILLGDVDLDGEVNLLDVDPFIDRIATGSFQAEADCNQDGEVNLLDVQAFITILSGG